MNEDATGERIVHGVRTSRIRVSIVLHNIKGFEQTRFTCSKPFHTQKLMLAYYSPDLNAKDDGITSAMIEKLHSV